MNKIIGILMLGLIGIIEGVCLGLMWLISMIYLLLSQIPGTNKFMKKFHGLNNVITEEFTSIIKVFKDIFDRV